MTKCWTSLYAKQHNQQLGKEILNRDGHQFHQYQQYEQSPLFTELTKHKETTTYDIGNPNKTNHKKCGGVKPVNGIPVIPS